MPIILPKTVPDLEPFRNRPLFFLAGPIRGGGGWHAVMAKLLRARFDDPIIVSPERNPADPSFLKERMPGRVDVFRYQTFWERHFLNLAGHKWPLGAIVFWLASESATEPRTDGQPYAIDTRGELGEWRGRLMGDHSLRVAVGADPSFPGLRVIKNNFEDALPGFPIASTMEEVADQAARLAGRV